MSKITFRADEELVERIEARDASKSEIMREALREYLDREDSGRASADAHATSTDAHATSAERGRDRDASDRSSAGHESPAHESASHQSATRGSSPGRGDRRTADALDAVLTERVDELVSERLAAWEASRREREAERAQDVNVNVTLESDAPLSNADASASRDPTRTSDEVSDARAGGATPEREATTERDVASEDASCGQCGESLSDDHVYCPNCGEKAARRVFCECGDEVRSDWGFCPSCGRRTPAADVLDRS